MFRASPTFFPRTKSAIYLTLRGDIRI
jgi:hypothetical protein